MILISLNRYFLDDRLLGPSTAQEVIQLTSGQSLNQGLGVQNPARVLMLDAASVSISSFILVIS
jgi:hypothetical protein